MPGLGRLVAIAVGVAAVEGRVVAEREWGRRDASSVDEASGDDGDGAAAGRCSPHFHLGALPFVVPLWMVAEVVELVAARKVANY